MDLELAALASAAAASLVTSMAKDGWEGLKVGIAGLWRREPRGRQEHIEAALDQSRQELADTAGTAAEITRTELAAEWQARFRRLLVAYPELATELAGALHLDQQGASGVHFGPTVHYGIGDVNQAAGDITVHRGHLDG